MYIVVAALLVLAVFRPWLAGVVALLGLVAVCTGFTSIFM
jgi:hypothetical protein